MADQLGHEEPILEAAEIIIVELVDIEEYTKRGEKPPHAHQYKFRIDDGSYTISKAELTGREILAFAGKTPEAYQLRERLGHGRVVAIAPDEIVNLREHGVERFVTIPKENTDGGTSYDC